jgi:hypothetical protein
MLIYEVALVRADPIDLFPKKYIDKPEIEKNPVLAAWSAKCIVCRTDIQDPYYSDYIDKGRFRDQADFSYVRKEMATGILATCKQV